MMKSPNILFLMSDEHRADIAGFGGNKIVRMPNLDNLAKDAVVFYKSYMDTTLWQTPTPRLQ